MLRAKKRPPSSQPSSAKVDDSDWGTKKPSEIVNHRSFVFYGRSGTGKTTLAASFPGPTLLLDINDKGTDSIADADHVDVKQLQTWDEFEEIYWKLKRNPSRYNTVVIDTVSQLQTLAMTHVLTVKGKTSDDPGKWGVMTKQEWGDTSSLMKTWLTNYRDLDCNTAFLAQDRDFTNEDEEAPEGQILMPEIGPQLMPSVAKVLNAAVFVIGNTFIRQRIIESPIAGKPGKKQRKEKIEYCLRIGPNPVYITKVRKPKSFIAPAQIVDPTYEAIMEIIKGE